jgi:hypothetical protein
VSALLIAPVVIVLAGVVIWHYLCQWADRPLTPTDRKCDEIDRDLDEQIRGRIGGWRI